MNSTVKRLSRIALFTAAALIMFLVESALPPLIPIAPGAKMGLSNVVTLAALILLGGPDAFAVLIARCLMGAVFAGNVFSLIYSIPAGLISLFAEAALFRFLFPRCGIVFISVIGAELHNFSQLAVASAVAGVNLMPLLPLMFIAGAAAGIIVGLTVFFTVRYMPKSVLFGGTYSLKRDARIEETDKNTSEKIKNGYGKGIENDKKPDGSKADKIPL